jgi:hypothetical protein
MLAVCHIVLALMLCFADSYMGMYEMMSFMNLLLAACSINFCFLLFYVMLMINDLVYYLCAVGLIIQDKEFKHFYNLSP